MKSIFPRLLLVLFTALTLTACEQPIEPTEESKAEYSQTSSDFTLDDPVWGQENALMNMVVFSDFQCPYCAEFYRGLKSLDKDWIQTGKLKIQYRDFPLPMHPYAVPVHMAAEAAHRQGKYWEMKDILFRDQAQWTKSEDIDAYLSGVAQEVGLDMNQFISDIQSSALEDELFADRDAGRAAGVTGTPGFLINGKLYKGAFNADELVEELQFLEKNL